MRRRPRVWVENLDALSIPRLFALRIRHGRLEVHYVSADRWGLRGCDVLRRLGVLTSSPRPTGDLYRIDSADNRLWQLELQVLRMAESAVGRMSAKIPWCRVPGADRLRALLEGNLRKFLAQRFWSLLLLAHGIHRWVAGRADADTPPIVLSRHGYLGAAVRSLPGFGEYRFETQWSPRRSWMGVLASIVFRRLRAALVPAGRPRVPSGPRIAVAATRDDPAYDLFFLREGTGLSGSDVLCVFDRADHPATRTRVSAHHSRGIECVALRRSAAGELPGRQWVDGGGAGPLGCQLRIALGLRSASRRGGRLARAILLEIAVALLDAQRLAGFYLAHGVRAVVHYQEVDLDPYSLACEIVHGIRVGVRWSVFDGPCAACMSLHQMVFAAGRREVPLLRATGSIPRAVLLAGWPHSEMPRTSAHVASAARAATDCRDAGATFLLCLLDTSLPTPSFYRAFFDWLLEDPRIGLILKPKNRSWEELAGPELGTESIARARATGRVVLLDANVPPAVAAGACDLAVGVCSLSAVVLAALGGSRIVYLDYGRLDRCELANHATLHTLAPRCVAHETADVRAMVEAFLADPAAHPDLGDASRALPEFDRFRDGRAGERVGAHLAWYLEGLASGLGRDEAIGAANERYASRWGADAVILGPDLPGGISGTP